MPRTTDLNVAGATPAELLAALDERVMLLRQKREEIDAELRVHRAARPALVRASRSVTRSAPRARTAESQAGPGNVRKVADALRGLGGRATQAMLTEATGLNSGTMTYALRALESKGILRPTGESVRRSTEFALTDGGYVMPPGSGR